MQRYLYPCRERHVERQYLIFPFCRVITRAFSFEYARSFVVMSFIKLLRRCLTNVINNYRSSAQMYSPNIISRETLETIFANLQSYVHCFDAFN